MKQNKQPYGTVLIKASMILDFLSSSKNPQLLSEISSETGLTNSTASKILDTLSLIGYVKKDPETKKFSLGSVLIKYANDFLSNLDISKMSYPYLKDLQLQIDETVHLGIREGNDVLYVNKLETQKPVVCINSNIGRSLPLYCSAMGKAILADLPPKELESYLTSVKLEKITEKTINDKLSLVNEIKEIKINGYGIDDNENETGVYCLGAALSINGYNYGAISVSIPDFRATSEVKLFIVKKLLETKQNILRELQQKYVFI